MKPLHICLPCATRMMYHAEFMGGACHRGLRQSAETLLEDVQDDLLKQLARNKGYRLVLCGHSLGGGAPRHRNETNRSWAVSTKHKTIFRRFYEKASDASTECMTSRASSKTHVGIKLELRPFPLIPPHPSCMPVRAC